MGLSAPRHRDNMGDTDRAAGFLGGSPVALSRDDSAVCCSGCSGNKLSCSSDGSPSKYSLTLSSDIRRRSPAVREGGGTRDAFIFTCSIYRFLVAMNNSLVECGVLGSGVNGGRVGRTEDGIWRRWWPYGVVSEKRLHEAIVNRSDGFLNMTRTAIVASMHITRVGMAVCKIRRSVCTTSVVFTLASIMYYAYIHT